MKVQYKNGDIFEGKINARYQREGPSGKLYYRNGDRFEGEWKNDKRVGRGKLFFEDGSYFEGFFQNDQMNTGKFRDK